MVRIETHLETCFFQTATTFSSKFLTEGYNDVINILPSSSTNFTLLLGGKGGLVDIG